jgi:hypothetical protein
MSIENSPLDVVSISLCPSKQKNMRSTKLVRFRSLQGGKKEVSCVHPGVSLQKETGSYLYPTPCFRGPESFCPARVFLRGTKKEERL